VHEIRDANREDEIGMAKRMIRFMSFQNERKFGSLGENSESMRNLIMGKDEKKIVNIMLYKLNSLYGEYSIIKSFFAVVMKRSKEVFMYLENPEVEKTSDEAEQHLSLQSWLFRHRFKTKYGF